MRRPYTFAHVPGPGRAPGRRPSPSSGWAPTSSWAIPGESDDDFAATLDLVRALPFSYLHVFSYSDRRGTEAARLPGRVDSPRSAARSAALRRLAAAKGLAFRRRLLGRTREVLVLEAPRPGHRACAGLTGNYVEVQFPGPAGLGRRFVPVPSPTAPRADTWDAGGRHRMTRRARAPRPRAAARRHRRQRPLRDGRPHRGPLAQVRTPFGDPVRRLLRGPPRRSARHLPPPSRTRPPAHADGAELPRQYLGAQALGAEAVISVSAVGSMREDDPAPRSRHPRSVLRPYAAPRLDLLRRRRGRPCGHGASGLRRAGGRARERPRARPGATVHRGGTYICIEGPQFSTKAESEIYRALGRRP